MKQLEHLTNSSKGKSAMAFGIALTAASGLMMIGTCITDIASKYNSSIHHLIFKDVDSALVTGGITLGIGLISGLYGAIKYYNSN
jgi:hypothetical protein